MENPLKPLDEAAHMLGNIALETAANGQAARAEWELSAKRNEFFSTCQQSAQAWAIAGVHMPDLLHAGLFRTTSDNAILSAQGWQLAATKSGQ